jgi:TRAP-type C4-dicarboxylate transport system substrate-binding protein
MNNQAMLGRSFLQVLTLLLLCSVSQSVVRAQTRIRLATLLPQGTSQYHSLEAMGQQWRTGTSGALSLTIYAGGTMGSEKEMISRMRLGQLQAATLSVGGLSEIDSAVGAIQKVPLLYHSLDEMEYVRSKLQVDMESRLEQKGFMVIFWSDAGWVYILSRHPYSRPDEFRRSKVFVTADDHNEVELVNNLGFQAVPLEWSDVFLSLQTGMVDTVPITPFYAEASQLDTVAKHLLQLNYVPLVGATVVTKKAWDALSAEQREVVRKAAFEAGKQIQARSRAESQEAIDAMKKRSGLQVHIVPVALEEEWRHFAESIYPKMRGTMIPADVFDKALNLVAEYRAQQGKSHP